LVGIKIRGLTKTFGRTVAVKDLDLDIEDRSFTVLLGPSGCGKTTALRCITGLETPDKGEIRIGDKIVNDLAPKDRNVAMVFQNYALYPHMTVYTNIAFPLKMHKVPKEEIKERVYKTAELLRIKHLLDRKPKQLSGGEAQRVALGRAIVRNPHAYLMDEPLSNLDAKLRVYMRGELKRLQKELCVTTLYVTHDQVEAMTMADKVAIMDNGILQQVGSAMEIFDHPANIFVAGFIGRPPMNFMDGTLIEKDGSAYLDMGVFTLSIADDTRDLIKEKATGAELVLGVRPEDLFLANKATPDAIMKAEVRMIEPLGSEKIVHIKVDDTHIIRVRLTSELMIDIKDKIWVILNKKKMHIFDKKTGNVIF
jgi:multiple sugar transport system ATP-binding protein